MDCCLRERLLKLGDGGGGVDGNNDSEDPEVSPFLKVWVPTVILPGTQIGFAYLSLSS